MAFALERIATTDSVRRMQTRLSKTEMAVWAGLSVAAGLIPASMDLPAAVEVQGPAGVLMLVNFALTLPGRAPVWLVAVCTWVGLPLLHVYALHDATWWMLIALVPTFIGAGGGRLAGKLLDTATSRRADASTDADQPWLERPLSTRFLLATVLVTIAAIGLPSTVANLSSVARAPYGFAGWLALIWQIMTLLGWIGCAPMIRSQGPILPRPANDTAAGIRPLELLVHLLVITMLAVVHAAAIVAMCALLRIPLDPGWTTFAQTAFRTYLPLDALAYLTIVALGFASDIERHRREAEQREATSNARATAARLSALRARLNPHFLFNALNSVVVLARAGKTADTTRLVEGLTGLLRYVLDERRTMVPLREELDFARRYLEVQQVRFGDRLRYDVRSEDAANDCLVPQLLLQPIVENAVEHGVAQTLDGGRVDIVASMNNDSLIVAVDDDGPGHAKPSPGNGMGLGVATTRERLEQLYERRATLTIEHAAAGGTHVSMAIPVDAAHA